MIIFVFVNVRYGETWSEFHGGSGGQPHLIELEEGETIEIVEGRSQKRIDAIEFITNKGRIFGPFGGSGGQPFASAKPGCKLAYFSGSSQTRLDAITLHYECGDK